MRRIVQLLCFASLLLLSTSSLLAQSPNGTISGLVLDPTNRSIAGADIVAMNDVTGVKYATKTNGEGIYVCSWCELHGNQLMLLPTPQSGERSRQVRYPVDAGILGRVTAVTMRIADVQSDLRKRIVPGEESSE